MILYNGAVCLIQLTCMPDPGAPDAQAGCRHINGANTKDSRVTTPRECVDDVDADAEADAVNGKC